MLDGLGSLVEIDRLRFYRHGAKAVALHEDHRWVLPIVFAAQQQGLLPRPVKVVLYDRHPDAAAPPDVPALIAARASGLTLEKVIEICSAGISPHDDDWVEAGIHLGLLGDVFIFGVDDRMGELPKLVDGKRVFGRYDLYPGEALNDERLRNLWDVLDGEFIEGVFRFHQGAPPILLNIDLDCFAYAYRQAMLPWDEDIFKREFGGSDFFKALTERAGFIAICREAGCCGGEANADRIFELVGRHLFEGALKPELP